MSRGRAPKDIVKGTGVNGEAPGWEVVRGKSLGTYAQKIGGATSTNTSAAIFCQSHQWKSASKDSRKEEAKLIEGGRLGENRQERTWPVRVNAFVTSGRKKLPKTGRGGEHEKEGKGASMKSSLRRQVW